MSVSHWQKLLLCQHLSDWFVVNALAFKRRLSGYYEPVGQTLTKHYLFFVNMLIITDASKTSCNRTKEDIL
ncbi:hypothetical protein U27_00552 [Candidatus Vecturithrix granuli]|uniref:Uncharacterized protein n=1 Tax=Vecturithrix granuli TaxID=1499967 RepID=A0A081C7V0_VECG1|nr:hypothetical protein U27_00552 [Candidatus Vecturithrix granuli]